MSALILQCDGTLDENLLLTAAVRDIKLAVPHLFEFSIRSPFPEIWSNNPYITHFPERPEKIPILKCNYPITRNVNGLPLHALCGHLDYLNERLNIRAKLTRLCCDIHLSHEEKEVNPFSNLAGEQDRQIWILNTESSSARTVERWHRNRYQEIVDDFSETIQFIQIGESKEANYALDRVIDLRGKTTIRALIQFLYHADGVLTAPGFVSHLAAAVGQWTRGAPPCIVLASGREPANWSGYPNQQFISAIGLLPCCRQGGCGKSIVPPKPDDNAEHRAEHLCLDPHQGHSRCMDMISTGEVKMRVNRTLEMLRLPEVLGLSEDSRGGHTPSSLEDTVPLNRTNVSFEGQMFIRRIPSYRADCAGRGIVICAGGERLFSNAWVCVRMLRHLGCNLPIEIWHLGKDEMDHEMKDLLAPFDVSFVDAYVVRESRPSRKLGGWELKPYAILNSRFKEILLLDADNVPTVDPTFLFETPEFEKTGAVFWPDFGHLKPNARIWDLCGVPFRDEPEWESGQILVNKETCWRALMLTMWYNEHSDFFYNHILGDKETFHMAFRRLDQPVAMTSFPVRALAGTLCQHDFTGRRIFQHRAGAKWDLYGPNPHTPRFLMEKECLEFLHDLRRRWKTKNPSFGRIHIQAKSQTEKNAVEYFISHTFEYVRVGYDRRVMTFGLDGRVIMGAAGCERFWDVREEAEGMVLEIYNENHTTCRLLSTATDTWSGKWLYYEQMPIELRQIKANNLGSKKKAKALWGQRKSILFRAPLNGFTGYGLHSAQIVHDLTKMGYDITIRATNLNETHAPIPLDVRKRIECRETSAEWELVLLPPAAFLPRTGTKTMLFTMWESTGLSAGTVSKLNQAYELIVPCQWNASCFSAAGVTRPINVVPLGIKPDIFCYSDMYMGGPCVFGTAGRFESGGMRKGITDVIALFKKAFQKEENVRLHIKVFSDDAVFTADDPRIVVTDKYLSEKELAAWLGNLTCYVSGSHGEGWGLLAHQALAIGRPVIGAIYGGMAEYYRPDAGYPLRYTQVPAGGYYENCGLWCEIDETDCVKQMRRVYHNRILARKKGLNGSRHVSKFTWWKSSKLLSQVLKDVGMID